MGGCLSSSEKEISRKINNELKVDLSISSQTVKLLLLGAGESGKSTILKQLKLIHEAGYSDDEKAQFHEIIIENIITAMHSLVKSCLVRGVLDEEVQENAKKFIITAETMNTFTFIQKELVETLKELWNDKIVQETFKDRAKYKIHISSKIPLFLEKVDEIASPTYLPTENEIVISRSRTTGVIEKKFTYKNLVFRIFDVGGQRSERKKWLHLFDDVSCLIFCVATSEYDEVLMEDETVNRMQESLRLFDSICNSEYFKNTNIILFLNKMDLFKEKIVKTPLTVGFPEYDGEPNNPEEAILYIQNEFLKLVKEKTNTIYIKHTCATDLNNIKFIFDAVTDIIISKHLSFYYP